MAQPVPTRGYELAFTPFLPVRTMMQNYQPMRSYLEKRLHEPVTLVTAPNYRSYVAQLRMRAYDFVITSANSAYLAYAEFGYIPLLRPVNYTSPTLVVAKDHPLSSAKELRGAIVSVPDAMSIVAMQAETMLRDAGLDPHHDVILKYMPNHSAAANYVLSGEATAAIISDRALAQMPDTIRNALRVVDTWKAGAAPGVIYLANPRLPPQRIQAMKQAILAFVQDTAEGKEMMLRTSYAGLVDAKEEEFKALESYGLQLKKALAAMP